MTIRALAGSGRSLNQVAEDSKGGTECRQSGASGPQAGRQKPDRERRVERAIGHEPTGGSVCQPAGSNPAGRPAAGTNSRTHAPPSPDSLPGLPMTRPRQEPKGHGAHRGRPHSLASPLGAAPPVLPWKCSAVFRRKACRLTSESAHSRTSLRPYRWVLWHRASKALCGGRHGASAQTSARTLRPALLRPAGTTRAKATSGPGDTCSPARECDLLGPLF